MSAAPLVGDVWKHREGAVGVETLWGVCATSEHFVTLRLLDAEQTPLGRHKTVRTSTVRGRAWALVQRAQHT